jgi:hypothetical protein
MTPPDDELTTLAEAAVEGRLTEGQARRLEELVTTDPAARAFYAEYVSLHAALRVSGGAPAVPAGPRAAGRVPFRSRRAVRYTAAAAAAAACVAAGAWAFAPPGPVATLADATACRWDAGTLPTATGSGLPPGRLRLAEGLARITFGSGAEVRLEGPADLELVSPLRCVLHGGRLTATVPPGATGFVVETPNSVVTDYGTEFGVSVGRDEVANVHVFSGHVDVLHRPTGRTEEMRTGASRRFAPDGAGPVDPSTDPDRPPEVVPGTPPGTRAVQVTTAQGRGRDAYVQPPTPAPHRNHSATLLLVKRAMPEKADWDRRAYLGFDLAGVGGGEVVEAELGLTLAPTRLGFAALVPDATFGVYGVTGDWDEKGLAWDTAPAGGPAGAPLDPARAVRVAEFVVPQGQQTGRVAAGGPGLAEFLRAGRDGLVTLVVVRETPGIAASDLVHGFASRRHPTLAPPTLRLTVREK